MLEVGAGLRNMKRGYEEENKDEEQNPVVRR
jgi:hypothetical protein